jgi:hypothetical protein
VVYRVRWPVRYGEEREASRPRAVAALAKLADNPRSYGARPGRASLRTMGDATREGPPFPSRLPSFLL